MRLGCMHLGCLHWVTLDPSGIEDPRLAPGHSGSSSPPALTAFSLSSHFHFLRDDRGCPQPRHRLPAQSPGWRGQGLGVTVKVGALRTRETKRKTLPARRSEGAPVSPLYRKPPRSALGLCHHPGEGGPGRANRRKQKIPYRGRDETVGQGSARAALGFQLRLPSTPGYRVAEAGAAAPAGCPILPLLLPPPARFPRPAPPAPALSSDCVRLQVRTGR